MSNRKIEISPSVLGADLMRLGEAIKMVESLGIHWLHLDNMDGHFAPNISFGPDFVRAIRKQTNLFLDTHLMLSEPMKYIEAYAKAGADLITVHAEADDNCAEVLEAIHALGVKAGVSIKGCYYTIEDFTLESDTSRGMSNVVTADEAVISAREGDLMLFHYSDIHGHGEST